MSVSPIVRLPDHIHNQANFIQDARERLSAFDFELHPEKTRIFGPGRFAEQNWKEFGGWIVTRCRA